MLTFSLKVPPDLRALRTIQAFIEESAAIYGFKNKKIFSLIAEEAFLHIFTRLKKEESDSLITITTESDEKYFIISFKDKGMPIGSEKELSYMEKMELAIIRANCEKLSWINHGKKGNELKILIKKPQKNITEYEIPFEISRKNEISTNCETYRKICEMEDFTPDNLQSHSDIPHIPHIMVNAFKWYTLKSMPDEKITFLAV